MIFQRLSVAKNRVKPDSAPLTAKNIVISPNFLVWKFCKKAQFPHRFERFARNYVETVPFHKIYTPGN